MPASLKRHASFYLPAFWYRFPALVSADTSMSTISGKYGIDEDLTDFPALISAGLIEAWNGYQAIRVVRITYISGTDQCRPH